MTYRTAQCLLLVTALSACNSPRELPGPEEFDSLFLEVEGLGAKLDTLDATLVLPDTTNARYDGVMIVGEADEASESGYLGDFSASVDFVSGTVDGAATGFYFLEVDSLGNPTGPAVEAEGTITVDATAVTPGLFAFEIGGALEIEGEVAAANSGSGLGGFLGPDADMLIIEGLVDFEGVENDFEIAVAAD